MVLIILSFLTAFTLTYFAIPSIIRIALVKNLCDEPGERRAHEESTPSLGGIAIFAGTIFAVMMWTPPAEFEHLQYILCAFIIIFLIGAKDDIVPLAPTKKFIGQLIAVAILVIKADIQFTSFFGFLGMYSGLPVWVYQVFSMFTLLVLINAFNLIDGINGLAGSIGVLISGVLGCWFVMAGQMEYATLAFALAGAVIAFLRYNYTPARIFMGDTGSLIIGLICSALVVRFMEFNYALPSGDALRFEAIPALGIAITIIPFIDTLRVVVTRVLGGASPFQPDRRHIHHLLIDRGFSHMQATGSLVFFNALAIATVIAMGEVLELHLLLALLIGIPLLLTFQLKRQVKKKEVPTYN